VFANWVAWPSPGSRVLILDPITYENQELADQQNELERLRDSSHSRTLRLPELEAMRDSAGPPVAALLIDDTIRSLDDWLEGAGSDASAWELLLARLSPDRARNPFLRQHFRRHRGGG
jgi:hypothetical protein